MVIATLFLYFYLILATAAQGFLLPLYLMDGETEAQGKELASHQMASR